MSEERQQTIITKYGDTTIIIATDGLFRFNHEDEMYTFKSLGECHGQIDKLERVVAVNKRRKPLSLACLNDEGEPVKITGIHAGHGRFLASPALNSQYSSVYADTPLVRALFKQLRDAEALVESVGNELAKFLVKNPHERYGSIDQSKIDDYLVRLQKNYDTVVALASNEAEVTT